VSFTAKVTVNGIDVTSYLIRFTVTQTTDKPIDVAELEFREDIANFIDISIGDEIIIERGDPLMKLLSGYVVNLNVKRGYFDVEANNQLFLTMSKRVSKIYDKASDPYQGRMDLIFIDLCQIAGLDADNTTVQDTGNLTITRLVYNNRPIFEALEELRKIMNWHYYHNPVDDKIYFEPVGLNTGETTLQSGINIYNQPKWEFDSSQIGNVLTVESGEILVLDSFLYSGDGLTKEFNITYAPRSIEAFYPYVDEGDKTRLTGGRLDTSGVDYEVDVEKKIIKFAIAPAAGSNNVQVVMSRLSPAIVSIRDSESIKKYNAEFFKVIKLQNIITEADLETAAKQYLQLYKDEFVRVDLRVLGTTVLTRGDSYRIIDAYNSQDRYLAITSITYNYPVAVDDVTLGDKEWKLGETIVDMKEKIRKLESYDTESGIIINAIEQVNEPIPLVFDNFQIKQSTDAGVNWTWLCRRKFKYEDFDSLNEGTIEGNLDISYGDLRAGSQ
jgi:hypothetical protein